MKNFDDEYEGELPGSTMSSLTSGLARFINYDVVDDSNHKVGTLNNLWVDRGGHPLFLGIKTGRVFGKTHVVPTEIARISQRGQSIRLPYSEKIIRNAPAFESDRDLDVGNEREVYRYFHMGEPKVTEARLSVESHPCTVEFKPAAPEASTAPLTPPRREAASAKVSDAAAASPQSSAEEGRLYLSEELLKVGKRMVDAGGVRLRKVIRTETVTQQVELSYEELVIERVPAQATTTPAAVEAFMEKEIFIALRREEPVVEKECRVKEEVRCRKQPQIEKRNISDSIRKEDVEIIKGEQAVKPKGK